MDRSLLPRAMLLLGPTGSGKTPLGDELERHGFRARRCAHFDFGSVLRRTASTHACPPGLTAAARAVVIRALATGALLEDEHFHIARRLLAAFVGTAGIEPDDLLVLNGLPRHVGQARGLASVVRVTLVVCLACTPGTVLERIRRNSGGDRSERTDDSVEAVSRKLALFRERTAPLLELYAGQGAAVEQVEVKVNTRAADVRLQLEQGCVP